VAACGCCAPTLDLPPPQVGYDAGLQPTERLRTRAAAAAPGGTSGRGKR
jgi:hypothetical protein